MLLEGVNKCSAHCAACLLVGRCVVVSAEHLFGALVLQRFSVVKCWLLGCGRTNVRQLCELVGERIAEGFILGKLGAPGPSARLRTSVLLLCY